MRRRGFKLIRKTLVWLHRIKGERSIRLPSGSTELSSLRLYGGIGISDNSEISGVGDYDADSGKYLVNIKTHGRNLMGGKEFFTIHKDLGLGANIAMDDQYYTITVHKSANGTRIIDNTVIPFKENTTYTICAYMWYVHSAVNGIRNLRLGFEYSDGTITPLTVKNTGSKIYVTARSTPGKTVVAITSYADYEQICRIGLNSFGIFEGYYTDYNNCFVPYEDEAVAIALDEPLLAVGYSKDELDMLTGSLTRRNCRFTADGGAEIEAMETESETESEFRIMLPEPMKCGVTYLSSYPQKASEDNELPLWIYPSEDGRYIHLVADLGTDINAISDILSVNPLHIAYPLAAESEESVQKLTRVNTNLEYIDICTSVKPRSFVAEYL